MLDAPSPEPLRKAPAIPGSEVPGPDSLESLPEFQAEPLARVADADGYRDALANFKSGKWDPERWKGFRLRFGIYAQKQADVYMVRTKFPGGRLSFDQARTLAEANRKFGKSDIHITTRQDIQFYFVTLDGTAGLLDYLYRNGVTTREASGNTLRNVTSCPLAGVCPHEHVDAGAVAQRLSAAWLRHPLVQHMPRKFKAAISGCSFDCGATSIDDLGFIATTKDGRQGFTVLAGGGLGSRPRAALVLSDFVEEEDLPAVQEALARLHHRYSNRKKKMASRIKFLVDRFGEEVFTQAFLKEFEITKQRLQRPWEPLQWRTPTSDETPPPLPGGRIDQHDGGVGVVVRPDLGMLDSDRLDALADLAEKAGALEFRFTRDQNIVAVGLSKKSVDDFIQAVQGLGFRVGNDDDNAAANLVSCPGTSTCPIGITNSNGLSRDILADKDSFKGLPEVRLRISGCQNSCGQHHVGDIGLHGVAKKIDGVSAPHYRIHLGGEATKAGAIGFEGPLVPALYAKTALKLLLEDYAKNKKESETVRHWANRMGNKHINGLLEAISTGFDRNDPSLFTDQGDDSHFTPPLTAEGECAATAVLGEYLDDQARSERLNIFRAAQTGEFDESLKAGRLGILWAARRLLLIDGIELADEDAGSAIEEVKNRYAAQPQIVVPLNAVLEREQAAALEGGLDAFAQALLEFIDAIDQAVESRAASPFSMAIPA
jgi:sulfite reductase (ferredoxin)